METAKNIAWTKFWEERGRSHPDNDPIAIDGWDYGISKMGIKEVEELRDQAIRELNLVQRSKFLEVGCGAGMFLGPISEMVDKAVGCDLSESMLKRAHMHKEDAEVQVAEARHLPYASGEFNAILVYSVFHYFPTREYAKKALRELFRLICKNGRIWIGDVPDKSKRHQALLHREKLMKESAPKWPWPKVGPLEQRFYDKQFFIEFCESVDCDYRVEKQNVKGYVQGRYRFNIYIVKR